VPESDRQHSNCKPCNGGRGSLSNKDHDYTGSVPDNITVQCESKVVGYHTAVLQRSERVYESLVRVAHAVQFGNYDLHVTAYLSSRTTMGHSTDIKHMFCVPAGFNKPVEGLSRQATGSNSAAAATVQITSLLSSQSTLNH
jgi:hypothetical protein